MSEIFVQIKTKIKKTFWNLIMKYFHIISQTIIQEFLGIKTKYVIP